MKMQIFPKIKEVEIMICKKCNAENPEESVFCSNCGAKLQEEAAEPVAAPASAPTPAPQPVVVQAESKKIPAEYTPVSAWGYVGLQLLYCIPVVGFVFLLIHTFNNTNLNRRNFARSYWCVLLLTVIFTIVFVIIALLLTLIGINVGEYVYNY